MQFKKAVAIGLGTLVAGATFAFAGMAATDLTQVFPTTGTSALTGANTLVVVGASANPADIVGAIDVAARLGGTVTETKTITGTTSAVDGIEKDGVGICTSTTATSCELADAAATGSAFPSAMILTSTHYTGLKKSTISWKSNDYDYKEQVDVSGVSMSHDVTTDKVNGTETMVVESGDIKYEYVFDKALNLSTATTAGTTGTISSPEYTYPVKIKLMGKDFQIVGVGATSIKALAGNTGEASATSGVTSGSYTVYATQGVSDSWAKIVVKDATGTEVASKSISQGDTYDFSAQALTVKVTDVRAIGTSGDISGVDVVVGATGSVEKEYDSTADVTSTGTASDKFFGIADWGIQVTGLSGSGGYPGIPKNAKIQVVYKPSTTQYLKAGGKISLPNNYGELGFEGFNTDRFVTVTVAPYGGTSTYDVNSTSDLVGSDVYGLEISASPSGSIVSTAGNTFDKAYVLFNKTLSDATYGYGTPFWIGFWDKTNSKILTNRTAVGSAQPAMSDATNISSVEYMHGLLTRANTSFTYPFKITYAGSGDADWYLNVTMNFTHGIQSVLVGSVPAGSFDVTAAFMNKTAGLTNAAPQFRLGVTSSSAEDVEIKATTSGQTAQPVGKKTQDIVSDGEVIIVDSNSNGGSDKFVFQVPSKRLAAKVYFGKMGATSGTNTYQNAIPVTTPVGKLTSDYTDATIGTTGKNLIFVGGPCANKFVATLMNTTSAACLTAWYSEVGATDAAGAANKALIKVVENAFGSGKVALIVAGTDAKDTRNAAAKVMADGLTGSKYLYSTAASSSQ